MVNKKNLTDDSICYTSHVMRKKKSKQKSYRMDAGIAEKLRKHAQASLVPEVRLVEKAVKELLEKDAA